MDKAKRVLIVSASAGVGHIRAAAALEEALREAHPDVNVENIEALQYTNAVFRRGYRRGYNALAAKLPSVWGYLYDTMDNRSAPRRFTRLVDRLNSRRLAKAIEQFAPDRVVCTHFFPTETFGAMRVNGRLSAPVYVTLTDYDIHAMWVQPGIDHYFVATEEMAYALKVKGVGKAKVSVTGIPIMPVFSRPFPPKPEMRQRLGLRPTATTVLLAAGGEGMVGLTPAVALLADLREDMQLLAVAGRNEGLRKGLESAAESRRGKVAAYGFVNNMHELMAASDVIITKSGGLTVSECLAMALPMVVLKPIPGQEERNSDYLLENGVAIRANSPAHLVFKVRMLLERGDLVARMSEAARRIARPRAAYDVAREVVAGD